MGKNDLFVIDHTNQYFKYREQAIAEKKKRDERQFLTFIQQRPTSTPDISKSFPNLFVNKKQSNSSYVPSTKTTSPPPTQNLMNLPHCSNCGKEFGFFTSKIQCDLCLISFCAQCIKKLSSQDITGVLREGQVKQYCPKCVFLVTREESKRKFEYALGKAAEDPVLLRYNEVRRLKKAIDDAFPRYEHLSSSVTDFTKITSSNKMTFLQVYKDATQFQLELDVMFKEFDKGMKELLAPVYPANSPEDIVQKNMKIAFVSFLQSHLPRFKTIQTKVQCLELNTITNVYIVLCRISMDNQLNSIFWSKFKNNFQDAISAIRKELFQVTLKCNIKWENHKHFIDEMICSSDKSHLNIDGDPRNEYEGTILRKNIDVLKKTMDQVDMRSESHSLPITRSSLDELFHSLSDYYQQKMNSI